MGWAILQPRASPLIIHNWGNLTSFRADLMLLPQQQIGIALLYNSAVRPEVYEAIRKGVAETVVDAAPWPIFTPPRLQVLGLERTTA